MKMFLDNVSPLGATRAWLTANNPSDEQIIAHITNQDVDISVRHNRNAETGYLNYNVRINKAYGKSLTTPGGPSASGLPAPTTLGAPQAPQAPQAAQQYQTVTTPQAPGGVDPWASTTPSVPLPPGNSPF